MAKSVADLLGSPLEQERREGLLFAAREPSRDIMRRVAELADSDESLEIRFLARKCLHQWKRDQGATPPTPGGLGKVTADQIRAYFQGPEENKTAIIDFAVSHQCLVALPVFVEQVFQETAPHLIASLLIAIGRLGSEPEIRTLVPFLSHESPRVRANAVEALEYLGTVKAYPFILSMLKDPDNRVKANAVKAVRGLSPPSTIRILRQMVASNYHSMQASAAFALAYFPAEENVDLLAGLLASPEEAVRDNAARTLALYAQKQVPGARERLAELAPQVLAHLDALARPAEAAEPPAKPSPLAEALADADPQRRLAAVQEAVAAGDQSVARLLLRHLQQGEPDKRVVATILLGFGRLQIRSAAPLLIKGLGSADARTRANCVEALRLLNLPETLDHLVPLLEDPNNRVRANAIIALKDRSDVDVLTPLRALLADPDPRPQKSAIYAIMELKTAAAWRLLHDAAASPLPEIADLARHCLDELAAQGHKVPPRRRPAAPPPPPPPDAAPPARPSTPPVALEPDMPTTTPSNRLAATPPPPASAEEPLSSPEATPSDLVASLLADPTLRGWQAFAIEHLVLPLPADWVARPGKPSLQFLPPDGREIRLAGSQRAVPEAGLTVTFGTTPNPTVDAVAVLERRLQDIPRFFEGYALRARRDGPLPDGGRFLALTFDHRLEGQPFTTTAVALLTGNTLIALDAIVARPRVDLLRPVLQTALGRLHLGPRPCDPDLAKIALASHADSGEAPPQSQSSRAPSDRPLTATAGPSSPSGDVGRGSPSPSDAAAALEPFAQDGRWGYRQRTNGAIVIPPTFDEASPFRDGWARVADADGPRYLDARGRLALAPTFTLAGEFTESLAMVRIGDEWGYIDLDGNIVVKPLFPQIALMLFLFDAEMNWEIRCLEPRPARS